VFDRPSGCLFAPRCAYATQHSVAVRPELRPWQGGQVRCHYPLGDAQRQAAERSKAQYGEAIKARGYGGITTEIVDAPPFYFAEDYHQQYLAKNPAGYCGLGGTGVSCPVGLAQAAR